MAQANIRVGNIEKISGEVTIAGGDIYKGFTAEQVSELLTQITSTFQVKKFDGRCPYKGLDVFEEEDADLFFGREKLVDELVERVKDSRTVFITGPSGSGKSSLVRAGLIPALKQESIPKSDHWLYETIKPGRDPLEALASAFSRLKSPELGKYFRENFNQPETLHECAESALSGRKDQRLVLFIDQFEEVFTQVGKDKAEPFLNLLTRSTAIEEGRVIVLFAMRSDFVSNCATYPELNDLLNQQFIQIGAMPPDELVSAIAQPALRVGLKIDPDLIAQIINDMQGEPGALPLMQFALKDLFDSQGAKGGVIALTLTDYLKHGGVHKALERHADNAFSKLSKDEQELARAIFSGLIEIGRGTQDTRRTALCTELIPASRKAEDVNSIVQKLADARLIITDELDGIDTITISHEKLIDAWPWLKKLINENRDVIALQNEIASDAKEWEGHKRDPSYLYTGVRLINASEQMERRKLSLSSLAQEFVHKGITRQRKRQLSLAGGILAIFTLLALATIVFSNQANTNARLAQRNEVIANTAQAASIKEAEQASTAQAASTLAVKQQFAAEEKAKEALAHQLAAQAQSLYATFNSKQIISTLLDIQSMKLHPTREAANFLINNNNAAISINEMFHSDRVASVVFTPDGKYVASVSADGTARKWDVVTGKEIAKITLDDNSATVFSWIPVRKFITFSPDGKYVVAGGGSSLICVWEAALWKDADCENQDGVVSSIAVSSDGKYMAMVLSDSGVLILETTTGTEVARMTHDRVNSVAFSPDGKYVVSGGDDGTARIWDVASGVEVTRITINDFDVSSVAFSPNGRYVILGGSSIMSLWGQHRSTVCVRETDTGKEVACMTHDDSVNSVAFSPDGKHVVSGSDDGTARVWEATTGVEIARMTHGSGVNSVAFSPDGKYVVSGGDDGTARIWDVIKELKYYTSYGSGGPEAYHIVFSPDGNFIGLIFQYFDPFIQPFILVLRANTGKEVFQVRGVDITFSPDSKYVVTKSEDEACTWNLFTGRKVTCVPHNDYGRLNPDLSPDGRYLVSKNDDGTVRILDANTRIEIARMTHGDLVASVTFSPDSKYVVSESADGVTLVWEVITGIEVAKTTRGDAPVFVEFSPNGGYVLLVTNSYDPYRSTTCIWETDTRKEVACMSHDDIVNSAFSPDSKYVISVSYHGAARVWEATTGIEVALMTHDGSIHSVALSLDGKYVVSGGDDGTVRIWDATTGTEIVQMTQGISLGSVTSVAFSPDGKHVVSGSDNGTVRTWIWQTEDLIANACTVMPRNLTREEWKQYIGDALPYQAVCENLPIESQPTEAP